MANYCSNAVLFIGSEASVAAVRELFAEIQRKQTKSNRYHLPDFVSGGRGYMEDIETGQEWLLYETRWVPNLEVLAQIAERYELDFIARFEEPMNALYGEAVYTANELHRVNLSTYTEPDWPTYPEFIAIREMQSALLQGQQPER